MIFSYILIAIYPFPLLSFCIDLLTLSSLKPPFLFSNLIPPLSSYHTHNAPLFTVLVSAKLWLHLEHIFKFSFLNCQLYNLWMCVLQVMMKTRSSGYTILPLVGEAMRDTSEGFFIAELTQKLGVVFDNFLSTFPNAYLT